LGGGERHKSIAFYRTGGLVRITKRVALEHSANTDMVFQMKGCLFTLLFLSILLGYTVLYFVCSFAW